MAEVLACGLCAACFAQAKNRKNPLFWRENVLCNHGEAPLPGVLVLLNESRGLCVSCVPHPSHGMLKTVPSPTVAHLGLGLDWI